MPGTKDELVRRAILLGTAKRSAKTASERHETNQSDEELRQLAEDTLVLAEDAEVTLVRTAQALAVPRPSEDPVPPVGQTPPDPPRGDQVRRVTAEERKALGPGRDVWVKKLLRPDGPTKYYGLKPKRAYMEYDPVSRQPIDDWQFVPSSDPVPTTQVREEDTRVSSGRSPIWYLLLGIAAFIITFLVAWSWSNGIQRDLQQYDWNPLDNNTTEVITDQAFKDKVSDLQVRACLLVGKSDENQTEIAALCSELTKVLNQVKAGQPYYITQEDFDTLSKRVTFLEARVKTLEDHAIIVAPCPPGWEHMTSEELSAITGGACGAEIEP